MKNLLFFFLLLFVSAGFGQTVLAGKVSDQELGQSMNGALVKVFKNSKLIQQCKTGYDGNYSFSIEAGKYDLEVSCFTSYTQKHIGVEVLLEELNVLDIFLKEFGCPIQEGYDKIVHTFYFIPLMIRKDQTWIGQTFDSEQLKNWFR